nr:clathrin light chain 2-like [Malus domestica]
MASFTQPKDDSVPATVSTRPFDDDGYLPGLRPPTLLPAIRLRVAQGLRHRFPYLPRLRRRDDAFATQPASEALSPPSIYAESNGQGFDGGFVFRSQKWKRQNAIHPEKEKREKELLVQIIEEADEFKVGFYQKRKITTENNKAANREREKLFLANQEKFHAGVDKNYWKAIADLIPNEVPAIEKKRGKKDMERKPSILVVQGPKPGKPTELSRMRQRLLKLKHNTPPHLKPSPRAPAPTKDAKPSTSAPPKAAVVAATPEAVVAVS